MNALVQDRIEPPYRDHIVRLGVAVPECEAAALERTLHERFPGQIFTHCIRNAVYDCFVVESFAAETNKWAGLVRLCAALNVDPSRVVTIGDEGNDIPMLANAALSFAMGDARPEIIAAAKQTTRPQRESGVARVIDGVLAGEW